MGGKVKLPPELADLLRSDLERAIYEAALHRDDDLIARHWYNSAVETHRLLSSFIRLCRWCTVKKDGCLTIPRERKGRRNM